MSKYDGLACELDSFYPASIAFDAMDQATFNEFYEAAVAAVIRWWLPVAANDLHEAIQEFAA